LLGLRGLAGGRKIQPATSFPTLKKPHQQFIGHLPKKVAGRVVTGHVFSLLKDEISALQTRSDQAEPYCTLQYKDSQTVVGEIMATEKTTTLTFRIDPNIKEALCIAADRDHRSIANMVAVMIREHCARVGISVQDKQALPEPAAAKPKPLKP
jgi:hypothetical protein